jgi:hypothetical protein
MHREFIKKFSPKSIFKEYGYSKNKAILLIKLADFHGDFNIEEDYSETLFVTPIVYKRVFRTIRDDCAVEPTNGKANSNTIYISLSSLFPEIQGDDYKFFPTLN